jgi:hypothetical protein
MLAIKNGRKILRIDGIKKIKTCGFLCDYFNEFREFNLEDTSLAKEQRVLLMKMACKIANG